jgi:hypothetical protein
MQSGYLFNIDWGESGRLRHHVKVYEPVIGETVCVG